MTYINQNNALNKLKKKSFLLRVFTLLLIATILPFGISVTADQGVSSKPGMIFSWGSNANHALGIGGNHITTEALIPSQVLFPAQSFG